MVPSGAVHRCAGRPIPTGGCPTPCAVRPAGGSGR